MTFRQGRESPAVSDADRSARGCPIRGRVGTGRLGLRRSAAADRWTETEEQQPDDGSTESEAEDADDGEMIEANWSLIYAAG